MQLSNYRQSTLTLSYKKVRITNVDPEMGFLEGRDSADVAFQITFTFFHSPFTQVPKLGENWLITRLDNNWVLHSRFEDGSETTPIASLTGGDVRIEAPDQLYLNAGYEIIADFNKAAPSFANLGTATFPGSALYGSATLDQVNAGTVNISDRFITPLKTYLPTRNIVDGQTEQVLISQDNLVWTFRYRPDSTSTYKWDYIGGPDYMNFVAGTISVGTTGWANTTGSPVLTAPYDGEYIIMGGAEARSATNNVEYDLGLSWNGTVVATLSGFISKSNHPFTVITSYKLTSSDSFALKKGDVLREVYKTDGNTVLFNARWMKLQPIRVNADPLDDPEPVVETPYTGAG